MKFLLAIAVFVIALLVGTASTGEQVAVCHVERPNTPSFDIVFAGRTLWIAPSAVPGHLAHGDFEGRCEDYPCTLYPLLPGCGICPADGCGSNCFLNPYQPDCPCWGEDSCDLGD